MWKLITRKIFYLLILIFLDSCCRNDGGDLFVINASVNDDAHNLSEIAQDVVAIPLETNENCLISYINRVISTKEHFFVLSDCIYMFNRQGEFERKIGSLGRGPEEYTGISTFAVDEISERIIVASRNKLLCFGFNGDFIFSVPVNKFVEYIDIVGEEVLLISSKMGVPVDDGTFANTTWLYRLNSELTVLDSIMVKQIILPSIIGSIFPGSRIITTLNKKQYLFYHVLYEEPIVRDTLYIVESDKLTPSIKIDFAEASRNGEDFIMINMYRTDRYVFADYKFEEMYLFCYDLLNDQQYNVIDGFNDDFLNTGTAKLQLLDADDGTMYFTKQSNEVSGIFEGVDDFDNPVIILVQLYE